MKLRQPWLIAGLAFLGAPLVRWWMSTLTCRVRQLDAVQHPTDPRQQRCIYVFWHESLLGFVIPRTRSHVMISQHADGELITRVCRHLGIGVVRGSTTRGGAEAMWRMLKASRRTHLAVTPDGPRGPRRRVQQGVIFLATRTGLPIVPIGVGWESAWRARSWDRFAVPRPYSTAYCIVGPALYLPDQLDRPGLEFQRQRVETALRTVTEAAERWAERRSGRPSAARPQEALQRTA
jgi:lysophospholipid acyltransferase (LPLAT)-like uncharacterized protein